MPATKHLAKTFVDSVAKFAADERKRLRIDSDDVDLKISVKVLDTVRYDEHEDEQ